MTTAIRGASTDDCGCHAESKLIRDIRQRLAEALGSFRPDGVQASERADEPLVARLETLPVSSPVEPEQPNAQATLEPPVAPTGPADVTAESVPNDGEDDGVGPKCGGDRRVRIRVESPWGNGVTCARGHVYLLPKHAERDCRVQIGGALWRIVPDRFTSTSGGLCDPCARGPRGAFFECARQVPPAESAAEAPIVEPPQADSAAWEPSDQESHEIVDVLPPGSPAVCGAGIGAWRVVGCGAGALDPACRDLGHDLPRGRHASKGPPGAPHFRGKPGDGEDEPEDECYCDCRCVITINVFGFKIDIRVPQWLSFVLETPLSGLLGQGRDLATLLNVGSTGPPILRPPLSAPGQTLAAPSPAGVALGHPTVSAVLPSTAEQADGVEVQFSPPETDAVAEMLPTASQVLDRLNTVLGEWDLRNPNTDGIKVPDESQPTWEAPGPGVGPALPGHRGHFLAVAPPPPSVPSTSPVVPGSVVSPQPPSGRQQSPSNNIDPGGDLPSAQPSPPPPLVAPPGSSASQDGAAPDGYRPLGFQNPGFGVPGRSSFQDGMPASEEDAEHKDEDDETALPPEEEAADGAKKVEVSGADAKKANAALALVKKGKHFSTGPNGELIVTIEDEDEFWQFVEDFRSLNGWDYSYHPAGLLGPEGGIQIVVVGPPGTADKELPTPPPFVLSTDPSDVRAPEGGWQVPEPRRRQDREEGISLGGLFQGIVRTAQWAAHKTVRFVDGITDGIARLGGAAAGLGAGITQQRGRIARYLNGALRGVDPDNLSTFDRITIRKGAIPQSWRRSVTR